jgi:hypothetical protein
MLIQTALHDLFNHKLKTLPPEILEKLADSHHVIETEADSIAHTLELVAMAISSTDSTIKPSELMLSSILSGLGQRAAVGTMAFIMGEAECIASYRKRPGEDRIPDPATDRA